MENHAAEASLDLFLLPGGRPRRFRAVIHAGGRPRRLPRPRARRSSVRIASSICSRSWRRSASIFKTSMCSISTFPVFTKGLVVLKTEQELESCPVPDPYEFISLSPIFQEAFGKRNKTSPAAPLFWAIRATLPSVQEAGNSYGSPDRSRCSAVRFQWK